MTPVAEEISSSGGLYAVLIALIVSVIAPLVISYVQGRNRKAEREEDRQSRLEATAAAAERAELVLIQNEAIANELSSQQQQLAERTDEIIKTVQDSAAQPALPEMYLPNSPDELMNARRNELRALETALTVSGEIFRLNKERDIEVNQADIDFMSDLRVRVAELKMRMIVGEYGPQGDVGENGAQQ